METKTHWKKLVNPNYLGSYSLNPGQELILTIKSVVREMVIGDKGKKQECTVVYFQENVKPMILNRLNSKVITKIYGTPYIEDWAGKKIQIFSDLIEAFGEMVEALRIRPFEPKIEKLTLTQEMPAFEEAKKYIKAGGKIEDIEKKYVLSKEIKTALNAK
jgi:hypothetical protein